MATLDHLAGLLLSRLAWTSLQAVVLVGLVALLICLLPRLPAAARCALWWLVGLQVVLGLCWHTPIPLPLLAPAATTQVIAPSRIVMHAAATSGSTPASLATAVPVATSSHAMAFNTTATRALATHWRLLLATAWLLLLLAQLPALILQHRHTRRLRRTAKPLADAALQTQCARQARTLGLRYAPALLVSPDLASPQVSGHLRPVILWPAGHSLTAEESALALAHELAHLQRHDLPLGWIPVLAQRLFFFHPLLRWAMREYALNREAACDALAVEQQRVAPQDYGRLLLRLGVAHPLHAALAGASPTFHNLKRRLTMLQQTTTAMPRVRGWLLIALVALTGVLPYRVVATDHAVSSALPASASSTALPPPPPPAPPAQMPGTLPPPPPPAPPHGMPPPPPPPPPPPVASSFGSHHPSIETDSNAHGCDIAANGIPFCGGKSLVFTHPAHEGQGVVLFDQGHVAIAGTNDDILAAKKFYQPDARLLWFRHGNKTYVTRSPATLQQASALVDQESTQDQGRNAQIEAIGKLVAEEGQLVEQKGEIVSRQGSLVGEEGQLVALQPDTAQNQQALDRIHTQRAALQQQIGALNAQIGALQGRIRQQQADLHARQHSPMHDFNRLAAGLTKLADEALTNGSAQEVHP